MPQLGISWPQLGILASAMPMLLSTSTSKLGETIEIPSWTKKVVLSYGLDGPCHQIQDTVLKNPLSSPLSLVPAIVPGSRQVGSSQGIGGVRSPGTEFHSWPTPMMLT